MESQFTRRQFLKTATAASAAFAASAKWSPFAEASVPLAPGNFGVLVRHSLATSGDYPDAVIVQMMVDAAIRRWTGIDNLGQAWESVFTRGVDAATKICIKINCIDRAFSAYTGGTRQGVASSPEVVNAIVGGLTQMLGGTYPASSVTVYDDRGQTMMRYAHFNAGEMPYPYVIQYTKPCTKSITVNGKFQLINDAVDQAHYLINVPVIKDHSDAGGTFSMKNHYGSVNNPGGLQHGNYCRDDIPALQLASWTDAFAQPTSLHEKTAAIVVDGLYGLYNGGPTGGPMFVGNMILVGNDTVGIDQRCFEILNQVRASQVPPLAARNCPSIADAEALGLGSRSLVWIEMSPPSFTGASITPDPAYPTSTLSVNCAGWSDAEADAEGYRYQWKKNGVDVSGATGPTLDNANFAQGDSITCVVTAWDGYLEGNTIETAAVVLQADLNRPPSFAGATITPDPAYETSTLSVVCTGWSDPDGDPEGYRFQWKRNGVDIPGATGPTLTNANFDKGDSVTCAVTAWDGQTAGNTIETAPVVIVNSPPSFTAATITPNPAYKSSTLSVQCSGWSDDDGDAEGYRYQWKKGGVDIPGATSPVLTGSAFSRGDSITCVVTAWDGQAAGNTIETAPVVILNTPPSFAAATITPILPDETSTLSVVCSGWSDPDGDAEVYRYQWKRNGANIAGATGPTLDGSHFGRGDTIACVVTAWDGFVEGTTIETPAVVISNSPPSFTGAAITPDPASKTSTLSVVCTGWSDPDGTSSDYHYQWKKGGMAIAGATGPTLTGSHFSRGDSITCAVTAWDGQAEGNTIETAPVVIVNSPPSLAGATIEPNPAFEGDTLRVVCAGWADPDGDPEDYRYQWKRNGTEISGATDPTLSGADFDVGDSITCVVTPLDGMDEGAPIETGPVEIQEASLGARHWWRY